MESRWRLLPACGISRVCVQQGGEATDEETVQDRVGRVHAEPPGAGGLAGEGRGQLLIPPVELLEKGERAIDEVIDVMGRATIEAVLRMSAEQVAGPKEQRRRDADRELCGGASENTEVMCVCRCRLSTIDGTPSDGRWVTVLVARRMEW